MHYKHWQLESVPGERGEVVWIGFDRAGRSANTINEAVLDELDQIISNLGSKKGLAGIIFISLKKNGFIAGADVDSFKDLDNAHKAALFLKKGQILFKQIEALPCATVAAIQGFCMGGGLELSLACDYRVACDDPKTRLGLPEVKLGILPGWGGTVRSVQLLGVFAAMDLMLTGRAVTTTQAKQIGLVDAAVPIRQFKRAAMYFVDHQPPLRKVPVWHRLFRQPMARNLLAAYLKKMLAKKVKLQHYPSPYTIVDLWQHYGNEKTPRAYQAEIDAINRLLFEKEQTQARYLMQVFFLQETLKRLNQASTFKAVRIHVIGAGTMGGDIAAWCALRGLHVSLQDQNIAQIGAALQRAQMLFKEKLKQAHLVQAALDRLMPDVSGLGIAQADVIIEAIVEDPSIKQTLFQTLEKQAKPEAILATNTSSIPLDVMQSVMKKPERLVGIHYFNPVALMPLVEVVAGDRTDPGIQADAIAFVRQIDKLPLPVKSRPGFLVNRVLMPYLMEAVQLVSEGCSIEAIDRAATEFGMPMGPVTLADKVGLDVCLSVAKNLLAQSGESIPDALIERVNSGKLGIKTGCGFYRYQKGQLIRNKKAVQKISLPKDDLAHRLILRMLREAIVCLEEGIVKSEAHLDAGMIFGTGFAPFRGGICCYARSTGVDELTRQYAYCEKHYGKRFKIGDRLAMFQKDPV